MNQPTRMTTLAGILAVGLALAACGPTPPPPPPGVINLDPNQWIELPDGCPLPPPGTTAISIDPITGCPIPYDHPWIATP